MTGSYAGRDVGGNSLLPAADVTLEVRRAGRLLLVRGQDDQNCMATWRGHVRKK